MQTLFLKAITLIISDQVFQNLLIRILLLNNLTSYQVNFITALNNMYYLYSYCYYSSSNFTFIKIFILNSERVSAKIKSNILVIEIRYSNQSTRDIFDSKD